jgi:hypothetical protein
MKAMSLEQGEYQGISAMYNIWADPDLEMGQAAVHCIPCTCEACMEQLTKPWKPGVKAEEQERYAR